MVNEELNAEIAVKVYGFTAYQKHWESGAHSGYHDGWLNEEMKEIPTGIADYSGDLNAAVDALREAKLNYTGNITSSPKQAAKEICEFILEWTDGH